MAKGELQDKSKSEEEMVRDEISLLSNEKLRERLEYFEGRLFEERIQASAAEHGVATISDTGVAETIKAETEPEGIIAKCAKLKEMIKS